MEEDEMTHNAIGAIWQPRTLARNSTVRYQIGPLCLWVRRMGEEWHVASERTPDGEDAIEVIEGETPEKPLAWMRWAFGESADVLELDPAMPMRPIVVKPDVPLRIAPANEVTFFVSVPYCVKVFLGGSPRFFLREEPTVVLSNTWFGDPTDGELCYSIKTGASRRLDDVKKGRYRAICPVVVSNQSAQELNFEKICLRTQYVNLYRGRNRLWTNRVRVSFRGRDQHSEITYEPDAPGFEETFGMVGEARAVMPKSFVRRSFEHFVGLNF